MSNLIRKEASLGNQWEFTGRNGSLYLRPGSNKKEISQPSGVLRKVVNGVQKFYIRENWQFKSLVQDQGEQDCASLSIIFTHPLREALVCVTEEIPIENFIKPEIVTSLDELIEEELIILSPINKILNGTNWITDQCSAEFNLITVEKEAGFSLWKHLEKRLFYQEGVGVFNIYLTTLKSSISTMDEEIATRERYTVALREKRETLQVLQVSNPKSLFK